jgi:uncharacterized protein YndB with AHSA1/START domain
MSSTSAPPVRVSRTFAATRERVFDAWLEPDVVGRWLFVGPDSGAPIVQIDPRPGGHFSILERASGGEDIDHFGEYEAIERPGHLAFTLEVPRHFPGITRVAIDIIDVEGGCELTLTQTGVAAEVTEVSWRMMLATLARVFDAG